MHANESGIPPEALLALMRHVPSPVTIVTTASSGQRRGMTAGSFNGVSLEPLLVSLNVIRDSQMHDVLTKATHFAIHILSEAQADWSEHFAIPDMNGVDQFINVPHHIDQQGIPILQGSLGVVYCRMYAVHEAGDHSIVLGEVLSVQEDTPAGPLIYYDRAYHRLGTQVLKVDRNKDQG
jgi:flavin reductase (DIM6/NTAB) family NADH-FMN oxidoreductase RutF